MKVGKLRHRVRVQRPTDVEGPGGETLPGYEDLFETWASIEYVSGNEFFSARQVNAVYVARIVMRWRPGVEQAQRVLHILNPGDSPEQTETYDITAALSDPVILRRWITLTATCRVAPGFRSGE